jgi:glycosyltransferase involved in cell wall biosynthesis
MSTPTGRGAKIATGNETSQAPLLTVAVPTYNRAEAVCTVLDTLMPLARSGSIAVLVVDDGSPDHTWTALQHYVGPGVRALRNEQNLGYPRTICRIFKETQTDYLLMAEDDGAIVPDALARLVAWLPGSGADFIVTQWYRQDGSFYRGAHKVKPVPPRHVWKASAHGPGLAYRMVPSREALPRVERYLDLGSDAVRIYPQMPMIAHLIAGYRALYWPSVVCKGLFSLPSGITDHQGRSYTDRSSRISHTLGFDVLFQEMIAQAPDARYRRAIEQMRVLNGRRLYSKTNLVSLDDYPDVDAEFLQSCINSAIRRRRAKRIARRIPGAEAALTRLRLLDP